MALPVLFPALPTGRKTTMSQVAASLAYSRLPFIRKYFLARAGLSAEKWLALAG